MISIAPYVAVLSRKNHFSKKLGVSNEGVTTLFALNCGIVNKAVIVKNTANIKVRLAMSMVSQLKTSLV